MPTVKYSVSAYIADGTTTDYLITWDYLDDDHITVEVDGLSNADPTASHTFTKLNDTTVRVTDGIGGAIAAGKEIQIRRNTPITTRPISFADGSALLAADLNKNSDYLLYSMQEALDQVDFTVQFQQEAEAFRDETEALRDATQVLRTEVGDDTAVADAHRVAAALSETNAASSAANASTSETNAAASETAAQTAETGAAASAIAATASKNAAAASEAAASASETAAATSETNAAASEVGVAADAALASSKASAAGVSESNSLIYKNNAAASASNAQISESNASASKTAAANSAVQASNSENAAAISRNSAATYATNSQASAVASEASKVASGLSEAAAATQAGIATTKASEASASEIAAEAAKVAAEAALDEFTDIYLGAKASDPTTDNDGNALTAGDQYFSTTLNALKIYNGSAWQAAAIDSSGFVQTTGDSMTGNLDITGEVKADKFTNDEALPTVRPSLLLDFANSKTLDPRITFTRGSTATYWDGKTTTKAEENKLLNGTTLTGTGWTNPSAMTITPNAGTAPDGTSTATQLTLASGKAYYQTVPNVGSGTYTASVYVKQAASGSATQFRFVTNNTQAWSSGGTASVTLTSSWQRVTITGTLTGGSGNMNLHMDGSQLDGLFDSNSAGNVLIWGAQLEIRGAATAFTPTSGSPIVKYQPTLQTAASGEARFDHDPVTGESKGLLIEESRTNLMPESNILTGWYYSNVARECETVIAPDGTATAVASRGNTNGTYQIYKPVSGISAGTTRTYSLYVKKYGARYCYLANDPLNSAFVWFDLDNDAAVTEQGSNVISAGSEAVGNGWYRIWMVNSQEINYTQYGFATQDSATTAWGTANAPVTYSGIAWGYQFEVGAFPTSYTPTSGSTVTRAVEQVTMSNIASELNGQEGTLYIEATPPDYTTGDQRLVSIGSSHSNVVEMFREYSSTNFFFAIRHAGTTISQGSTAWAADTTAKAAIGYKSGDIGFAADGSLIMTNTGTFAGMEMNQMLIGRTFQGGASAWSGEIKKIAYYPQKFTNATLQAMTEE